MHNLIVGGLYFIATSLLVCAELCFFGYLSVIRMENKKLKAEILDIWSLCDIFYRIASGGEKVPPQTMSLLYDCLMLYKRK